jgi:SAM-dependent methyltransferase
MLDRLLRIFGWRLLMITGDPCVLDRWLWLRKRLRRGPLRTFDAGSGNGGFSIYAARAGNDVTSASFSVEEQQSARRRAATLGVNGVDFRVIDLREIEAHRAELGAFDQIVCLETIEHVNDDEGLVSSLAGMLAAGGRLLLSAPNDAHRPLYTEEREPSPVEDGSHVRYGYSPDRLAQIAAAAGLEILDQGFISGVIAQRLTDVMRRLTERIGVTGAWLAVLPLRPLVLFDGPLSRLLRYPYLSVALCAVKPAVPAGAEGQGA